MRSITDSLTLVGDLSVPLAPAVLGGMGDAELLDSQRRIAQVRRRLDALATQVAGEIAHRSRRELGAAGLAATHGVKSAEDLIATVSGTSRRDAHTLVATAALLPTATLPTATRPDAPPVPEWLRVIGDAVATATISTAAAGVIRNRLAAAGGDRAGGASATALAEAARALIDAAHGLKLDDLAARAARVRDDLDLAGIPDREQERHELRFLKITRQADGMTRLSGLLDPESAAIVVPILDAATSPRRGGPRFVDPAGRARADELMRDARSTEQLTLDLLVELVRAGARVDDGTLLGDRKPVVQILVTQKDLDTRGANGDPEGAAFFAGQTDAVSVQTAERFICAGGAVPILFDADGRVLNLGRRQRLFSERQRVTMAARDGGCVMCGAPPSWAEAHHIDHWDEHRGRTDVDDGVLLCRFCHLNVHNQRWRIRRHGGTYRLERPDEHGTIRSTPLPSRSPAYERLTA
ncbi:MAG: hypothetical protein DI534_08965 [Leifsonia xyli]|nr:MAG: hypothetical protein DI534_08965 [Leifsonia xyli]